MQDLLNEIRERAGLLDLDEEGAMPRKGQVMTDGGYAFEVIRVYPTKADADGPLPRELLRLIPRGGGAVMTTLTKGRSQTGDGRAPGNYVFFIRRNGEQDGAPVWMKPSQATRALGYEYSEAESWSGNALIDEVRQLAGMTTLDEIGIGGNEPGSVQAFLMVLASKLTQYDQREMKREMKRGGRGNIYRLGHLLGASQKVEDDMKAKGLMRQGTPEALSALKTSMNYYFSPGVSPVVNVEKQIDLFLKTGKEPSLVGGGSSRKAPKRTEDIGDNDGWPICESAAGDAIHDLKALLHVVKGLVSAVEETIQAIQGTELDREDARYIAQRCVDVSEPVRKMWTTLDALKAQALRQKRSTP